MLTIEEYIVRRKKEDKLNEFNLEQRNDNMRICVNYVFEYFNNYINITEAEEKTALHNEKIDRYRQQMLGYEPEVREWLVNIYSEYGKHMHRNIGNYLKEHYEFFLLFNSESEFRSISYECYADLCGRFPFLKDQTEMLFQFIKEHHRAASCSHCIMGSVLIPEELNEWIEQTWRKHQVSVVQFSFDWAEYFYNNEDIWPTTHRSKSKDRWHKYDYDIKQKSNLFNLDSLYRRMPKKSFTKGRKQEFEILMMYYWAQQLVGDDDGYWQEYLEKTLPALNKV